MNSKANNLIELAKAGFIVPKLEVLSSIGLKSKDIIKLIDKTIPGVQLFAVRSSALAEDGKNKSFAGQFYTELGVSKEKIYSAYQKVVASYKGQKGNVIIQEFISSDKAGVLFTNDGNGLMVINACPGLCKTVVDGDACDEWYVSRDGKILRKHIAEKKKPLVFKGSIRYGDETETESLNAAEVEMLVAEGLKIESLFGAPQDIEWCFYQDQLFILQSRPITRFNRQRNWVFYDSANIAESYSGVVLPLTHSFAAHIYQKVYENLLIASGAPRKLITNNKQIFSNMVTNFYGRMYYNMNNWYLMMSFMPGYKKNKNNLEGMLTMNIRVEVPRSVLPSFWLKISYPFVVVYKLIVFQRTINQFATLVKSTIDFYRNQPVESYTTEQCLGLYEKLNKSILEKFHIPVENDFLLMTCLGILKKKYNEEDLKNRIAFDNISSRQVEQIALLAKAMFAIAPLSEAIDKGDADSFKTLLPQFPIANQASENYFKVYGGRFANELKLESVDIEHETGSFLGLLKAYRNYNPAIIKEGRTVSKGFIIKRFIKYARQREELRLLRSNCFSLERKIFRRIGELFAQDGLINNSDDIFYLTIDEVFIFAKSNDTSDLKTKIDSRKTEYDNYRQIDPPAYFVVPEGGEPIINTQKQKQSHILTGRSCTPGVVTGRVRVFDEFVLPGKVDFDIMIARNTDPGWTALIGLSKGMIVENGGILSHAAIVSRELGIPTVIGVQSATQILKTGQIVELNGSTGEIKIVE